MAPPDGSGFSKGNLPINPDPKYACQRASRCRASRSDPSGPCRAEGRTVRRIRSTTFVRAAKELRRSGLSHSSGQGGAHPLGNARDVRIRVNERFKFLRPERVVRPHRSCRGLAALLRWEEWDPGHTWIPGRPVLAPEESRADGRPDSRTIGYEQASLDLVLPYHSCRTTWRLKASAAPFGAVLQGQNLYPNVGFF